MRKKFIFVTGGVLSALGKGLSSAAIGALLEARNIRVTNVKMDPYINVDPGTMSPYQHGEVYVTNDGAETDLDLGHYERFTANVLSSKNSFSAGRVYKNVIERERKGEYLGRTVQVIPHVTDEIKRQIWEAVEDVDLGIIEVGGTVGDIEGLPFLEAIRQFRSDAGPQNVLFVHLTLVPHIKTAGELKTKPTQHSVKELLSLGIQPDILICRSDRELPKEIRQKIAHFCNVGVDSVIAAPDVPNTYMLPLTLHEEGLDDRILENLGIWAAAPDLTPWEDLIARFDNPDHTVRIGMIGKYTHLTDAYKSLNESLAHGGVARRTKVELVYVDSEQLDTTNAGPELEHLDGILVPGGFGDRGIEGKIAAARYARENDVPYFGICLGMQVATIEFARNVIGLHDVNSREFNAGAEHTVIELMDEQQNVTDKGGTMRLGAYPCELEDGSTAARLYGKKSISERHRHRYEVNPEYHQLLRDHGMRLSGMSPNGRLVEMIELPEHPHFIGCQFHPEFQSGPLTPHPLFSALVKAAVDFKKSKGRSDAEVGTLQGGAQA
ncbi:MAG: CTP synthase [Proteobacteria bacterium]|nr:CTP synthase [Pseudomonadota bacterium]MCP4921238.1 CTP synthase [Pseudomonadota bacterium]